MNFQQFEWERKTTTGYEFQILGPILDGESIEKFYNVLLEVV